MSVPKLVFRAKPLKLPMLKLVEETVVVHEKEVPKIQARKVSWLYALLLLPCIYCALGWFTTPPMHRIVELKCHHDRQLVQCASHESGGTFVVIIPSTCNSVYEIGGVPFSSAGKDGVYRVPARDLTIKDVIGKCNLQAYLDSDKMELVVPFTFITTKQHTHFSIEVGGNTVVEHAASSMFDSVHRGNWIAYTYNVIGTDITVIGDGTDIIHVYSHPPSRLRP